MPTRIVPAFDKLEDGHAGLGPGLGLAPVEQLAFQGGEEALAPRRSGFVDGSIPERLAVR